MSEDHIPEEMVARFLARDASRNETRQVVAHLLTGCQRCAALVGHRVHEGGHWQPRQGGTPAAPAAPVIAAAGAATSCDDLFRRLSEPDARLKPDH